MYRPQRQARYQALRDAHFTPLEAREFSILPKKTPALQALVADRLARRERFDKIARRKLERGVWRPQDIPDKWLANLRRMYSKKRWRVQHGARGDQSKMAKGSPNPWAMYRQYEKQYPGKSYVSPWEVKQIAKGKTKLDKGTLFVQKAQRIPAGGGRQSMIRQWIDQLTESIRMTRGATQQRFVEQRRNLRKELGKEVTG